MAGRGGGKGGKDGRRGGGRMILGGSHGFQEELENGGEISCHQQRLREDCRNLTANYKEGGLLEYSLHHSLSSPF